MSFLGQLSTRIITKLLTAVTGNHHATKVQCDIKCTLYSIPRLDHPQR